MKDKALKLGEISFRESYELSEKQNKYDFFKIRLRIINYLIIIGFILNKVKIILLNQNNFTAMIHMR